MFGCEMAATARASRWNRRNASGSAATLSGSTLIATSRPSRASVARYTSPIPPAPSWDTMRNGPSRDPATKVIWLFSATGVHPEHCRVEALYPFPPNYLANIASAQPGVPVPSSRTAGHTSGRLWKRTPKSPARTRRPSRTRGRCPRRPRRRHLVRYARCAGRRRAAAIEREFIRRALAAGKD